MAVTEIHPFLDSKRLPALHSKLQCEFLDLFCFLNCSFSFRPDWNLQVYGLSSWHFYRPLCVLSKGKSITQCVNLSYWGIKRSPSQGEQGNMALFGPSVS